METGTSDDEDDEDFGEIKLEEEDELADSQPETAE